MFAEERDPDAGTPEDDAPESATPEGAPGEPGESTPERDEDAAVGPEIEGMEALSAASEEAGTAEPDADAEEPAADAEEPAADAEEPAAESEEPAADEAAAEGDAAAEGEAPRDRRPKPERSDDKPEEEVIPGMHLEPDLVLEEQAPAESEFGQYAEVEVGEETAEGAEEASAEPEPVAHTPLDLAADARYRATGKRKSAVARVILRPGEGTFTVNGRHLDEYFPRVKLQRVAQQPLEAAGYNTRLDVVARIHGGGVSAQATALRHGIARALVEADPALRGELKRRGYLTRDPRVKERKKAGLKKARKRPQFSKR
ncbi:MAG: small subunit ribosomal protein [Thermoleophilaceae bacterium]|jgi:small subunit ribosomal protein S9|nr:small subunit ribosomal protein [Thermoleophilaceae bacterium]